MASAAAAAIFYLAWTSASLGATPRPPAIAVSAVASLGDRAAVLYPGGSVHVKVTLTNNTEHRLRIAAGTIEGRVSNLPPGCLPAWFRFDGDAGPAVVVAGKGGTGTAGGRLTFVDTQTDQSACAGAAPKLSLRPPAVPRS